jgi:hypothetical protein
MDDATTLSELKQEVQSFCEERDWDQFHDPLHLAVGASGRETLIFHISPLFLQVSNLE